MPRRPIKKDPLAGCARQAESSECQDSPSIAKTESPRTTSHAKTHLQISDPLPPVKNSSASAMFPDAHLSTQAVPDSHPLPPPLNPHCPSRQLIPLQTLQNNLYRQLYPFDFDSSYDLLNMSQSDLPPPSHHDPPLPASPHTPKSPVSPTADSRTQSDSVVAQQPHSSSPDADPASGPETSDKPASASNSNNTPSANDDSSSQQPAHVCQWVDCDKALPDPESLYNHLCNDHIGRKSTGNLCLTCKWKDCGTTCAKRDHITSHLRGTFISDFRSFPPFKHIAPFTSVHTPLKPHVCEICKKPFKRPQDLKKHEKIHTEEHHAQHKHSKAITVADPAYSTRVRGDPSKLPPHRGLKTGMTPAEHIPVARAKSGSLSLSENSSGVYLCYLLYVLLSNSYQTLASYPHRLRISLIPPFISMSQTPPTRMTCMVSKTISSLLGKFCALMGHPGLPRTPARAESEALITASETSSRT